MATERAGKPVADEGVDDGPLPGTLVSVEVHQVGVQADRNRTARRRGGGRDREDGTGHQGADRANGEDCRSEDLSPNAHDCLHAFSEVTAQTSIRRP